MSLTSAKCPNCGASIQVDSDRQEAFCSYCGSKVTVQEAVNLVKIDASADLANFLEIAKTAIESHNGEEGHLYANKVLEIDSTNGEAWLLKMKALDFMGTLQDLRVNEIISTGKLAIKQSKSEETKKEVYEFFLFKAQAILSTCTTQMMDYQTIKQLYEANLQLHPMKATELTLGSDTMCDILLNDADQALLLRKEVPNDAIVPMDLTNIVVTLAQQYVEYTKALSSRFNAIGAQVNDQTTQQFRANLAMIKEGLPEEHQAAVSSEQIDNPKPSGCYIATAVYGSYEAPEVMILREFRDNVLQNTWLGRAFIKFYYAVSPALAVRLRNTTTLNHWVKNILDKWVNHLRK